MDGDFSGCCNICKGIFNSSQRIMISEDILNELKCLIPNLQSCTFEDTAICRTCLEKIQLASTFKTSYLENCQNNLLTKTGNSTCSVICEICKRICNQEDCIPLCDSVSETGANLIRYLSVKLESKLQDDSQTCEVCHKSLLNFYSITNLLQLVNSESVDELKNCDMIEIEDTKIKDNLSVVNSLKTEVKEDKAAASKSYAVKEDTDDTSDNEVFQLKQEEMDIKMDSEDDSEEDGNDCEKNEKKRTPSALSNINCSQSGCTVRKNRDQVDMCEYQTVFKNYVEKQRIEQHIIPHQDIKIFKCEICPFVTTLQNCMKEHVLIHENSYEVEMFKCEICEFETNYKNALTKHVLVHKNLNEVEVFICHTCNLKTKYRESIDKKREYYMTYGPL